MIKKLKSNKAFTLIELLVVIVVLAILVLLAAPKLLNYIDEAELARIQHDTKVMENKMAEILNQPEENYNKWVDNGKDLGTLVLKNQLFEKEGLATAVNMKHLTHGNNKVASLSNPYEILGLGGDLYEIPGDGSKLGPNTGYKIVPESFKKTIGTHLDGTFYVNKLGKVYYEPNKPIGSVKQDQPLACVAAETLDYEFDGSTGTIVKYNGILQYINIPSAFEVDGKCVSVKIIGSGAFMRGDFNFKKVTIPQSVKEIQEDAFKGNELTEIEIPHSVDTIGENAFADNKIENVIIKKSSNDINIGSGAFNGNGSNGTSTANPIYKVPTASDLKIVFNKSTGTIVSGYGGTSGGSYGGSSGSGSGGSSGGSGGLGGSSGGENNNKDSIAKQYDNSSRVISIPKTILVDGEEHIIKEISKGAFQGQGIIYVEFPDSLERIEDYAFAGNQLIGVTIPSQIGHIGNYAFAFNEINEEQTIDYVNILNESQKEKINDLGNIAENGQKVDLLKNKVGLLDHIFIISTANFEIPMEYNPVTKFDKSEIPSPPRVSELTGKSAVIDGGEGTEISLGDGVWHNSPHTFADLGEGISYKSYSRYKETDSHYASKISEETSFSTIVIPKEPVKYEDIGSSRIFTAPATGSYQLEVWGAQGGSIRQISASYIAEAGGLGGYAIGNVDLTAGDVLNIYVGGHPTNHNAGWNGGGKGTLMSNTWGDSSTALGGGGGGATDIRLGGSSLQDRIIVAGGGGGAGRYSGVPGVGGGLTGGTSSGSHKATGGTQSSGGIAHSTSVTARGSNGILGSGGDGASSGLISNPYTSGGGGGGYYGGAGGSTSGSWGGGGGSGGSGYIGGVQNGQSIAGNQSMPNPNGGTMVGNAGNGFAKITYIGN